jgi:cysteine desulfurase/selenocysteine lyase
MFDPSCIRDDFLIFRRVINGNPLIYFDNAATTQKPIQVIRAISTFYENYNANIHRAAHTLSSEATKLYEDAHHVVADFIGASSMEEVIFVKNTTEAINILAYSLGLYKLGEGDEVLLTIMDHHSNLVPWSILSRVRGFKIKVVDIDVDGRLDMEDFQRKLSSKTRVVSVPHISNVLGTVNDIRVLARLAHEVDAYFIVDAAQSVPHMPIDVRYLDVDFLAFSGHKMLGPTGIGVLYGKRELLEELNPFLGGGDMIMNVKLDVSTAEFNISFNKLPWRFEAGTPNIAGAVGIMEAIKYLRNIGMDRIYEYEGSLVKYVLDRMRDIDNISIYGPLDGYRGALVSFNIDGVDSHETALLLDGFGIMVRSGLHCAEPLHDRLGIPSSVRASFYIYNTFDEVDRFLEALKVICEIG